MISFGLIVKELITNTIKYTVKQGEIIMEKVKKADVRIFIVI